MCVLSKEKYEEFNKYNCSKIYKIISKNTNNIYIGSTCKDIRKRFDEHKRNYNSFLNNKCKYIASFEILKYGDCKIELVEDCVYDTKAELRQREGYYIVNLDNVINKNIAGRSKKDYQKKYYKEYYEKNKEEIKDKYKIQYHKNKENTEKNEKCKLRTKEYYMKNKNKNIETNEKSKIRNNEHYIKNKEQLNIKAREKHVCLCGGKYTNSSKSTHFKSIIHLKFENSKPNF